jgi:adenylate kinase
MKIYITGSPGTGKSTLGKELQKTIIKMLNIDLFEIRELLEKNNLLEEYEQERDTTIFDLNRAMFFLQRFLAHKESYILVGPLIPFNHVVFDYLIVLTCSKRNILYNRLLKRNYKLKKIEENIEAELLGEVLGNTLDWLSKINSNQKPLIYDSCILSSVEIVQKFLKNNKIFS